MKILRIYTKLPSFKGGMEKHIKHLSEEQNKLGHEVTIFFNAGDVVSSKDIQICNFLPLYRIKPQALGMFVFYLCIILSLVTKKRYFDVIHIHGDWSSLLFSHIIKRVTKAEVLVFSLHGLIGNKFTHRVLLIYLLKKIDLVFSTGYDTAKEIMKRSDKKVIVQPSGVNEQFFQNIPKFFNFNLEKKRIVTVANLFPKKNIPLIIEIAKELQNVDFDIIGDGPQYDQLMIEIKKKQLKNVRLLGFKSTEEILEAYLKADCFLLTSLAEGTPTSMMEAIVVGLPVVSSNAGGVEHIVKEGENGYVIKSGRKEEYVEKLNIILNDPELTLRVSQNNKFLGKSFSWDYVTKRITRLIEEALDEAK